MTPPEATIISKKKCTVILRTLYPPTKKIRIAPQEIERNLEDTQEDIVIYTRSKRYGAVEVKFADEEAAFTHVTMTLKTEE